jgi:mono/diheme cytochrome c family protein
VCLLASVFCLLSSCRKQEMGEQPRYQPLQEGAQPNGMSGRPLVNGTVPRGHRAVNDSIYAVTTSLEPEPKSFPFQTSPRDLQIGQERYNIYCSVCHGRLGDGEGMIVKRGFPHPPSFYLPRLRNAPPGHYFNVISNGFGAMYSYGDRIEPDDRWRIAGYIRALQASAPNDKGENTPPAQRK